MSHPPRRWLNGVLGAALMVLATGVALYVAARLIIAVLPVLIGISIAGLIGWALWSLHSLRKSRW